MEDDYSILQLFFIGDIEKSIFISKQFNMEQNLVDAYILFAKLYQELALPKTSLRADYIKNSLKMFQMAKSVPIVAEHKHLQQKIKDEIAVFTSFCKLNGIALKKNTK